MEKELLAVQDKAVAEVGKAATLDELAALETRFLGRKGEVTLLVGGLASLHDTDRREMGKVANAVKERITLAIEKRRSELKRAAHGNLHDTEWIDVTEPGIAPAEGHLHITTQAIREIETIFTRIGFERRRYPEVEWDWYAFESLNMPKDHPARDEWETFFMADESGTAVRTHTKLGKMVLTPHTSSGQAREMQRVVAGFGGPPIRMVNIAKCYRRQADVSHVPMFHQFEGFLIDRNITIAHLKGTIDHFVHSFFGPDRRSRLRPFHFRFTEPSFEVDVSCSVCNGTGRVTDGVAAQSTAGATGERCRLCKSGWLELAGAGMVHPNVLKAGGIDPNKYSGFAFGFGVERSFMMKSGLQLDDIRVMYKNDLRFVKQF